MTEVKVQPLSEWVKQWDRDQWESVEWRQFLISAIADYEDLVEKLSKYEEVCAKQKEEIQSLEKQCELLQKQLKLLQKTLEVAERFTRPIIIPDSNEVIKNG